jgi:16S rRNA (guanine966-N2)-methyltransferase
VADLFAGSGALGIEALSRGAASVTFVDRDPDCSGRDPGQPGSGGAGRWGAVRGCHRGAGRRRHVGCDHRVRYDLVLCDPPYDYEGWTTLVGQLPGRPRRPRVDF